MKKIIFALACLPLSLFAQWNLIAVFNDTLPQNNQYRLQVIDENSVLLYPIMTYANTSVKKSVDGGSSWATYALPVEAQGTLLHEADFVNNNLGYLVGGTSFGSWNVLLKTVDGGAHWTSSDMSFLTATGSHALDQVDFVSENTGYIVSNSRQIYKTTDGGINFSPVAAPVMDSTFDAWITELHFLDEQTGFVALLAYRHTDTSYRSHILKTTDAGQHWQVVDEENWSGTDLWHKTDIIQFVNNNDGFAIGGRGYFKLSHDGGASWAQRALPLPDAIAADLSFVNNACGYIVLDNNIYRTDDAGLNWTLQTVSSDSSMVHYVQMANDSVGYASGNYDLFVDPFSTLFKTKQAAGPPLSLDEPDFAARIRIYPNPAQDFIHLAYPGHVVLSSLQLTDGSGRVVRRFFKDERLLSVRGLAKGIYFLHMATREGFLQKKVVIN